MHLDLSQQLITGPSGQLAVHPDDQVAQRLAMLIEGQCEGLGAAQAAAQHGLSVQRYFQLLRLYREQGAGALQSRKPGPKANYVRTEEVTRQVIRHRFLDPDASTGRKHPENSASWLYVQFPKRRSHLERARTTKKNSIATDPTRNPRS